MNYKELIQERQSHRDFTDKQIKTEDIDMIRDFFADTNKLTSEKITAAIFTDKVRAKEKLEGIIGYKGYALGAPAYLFLLGSGSEKSYLDAGYRAMNTILKLQDSGLDSCFLTVEDSDLVKKILNIYSDDKVLAVIAFGYAEEEEPIKRIDIISMSNVKVIERKGYVAPKIALSDMVYNGKWGETFEFAEGLTDEVLEDALFAASLAPYYLNKQEYHYLLRDNKLILCNRNNPDILHQDALIGVGCTLFNFDAIYKEYNRQNSDWVLEPIEVDIPEDYAVLAYRKL